jgi:hypothetical protein
MSRNIDVNAAEFATVRATLGDSQGQFAERLGVSRRTVIRGEQRGIEMPRSYGWGRQPDSTRGQLADKWKAAREQAERHPQYLVHAEGDAVRAILDKMSQEQKGRGYTYSQGWHAEQFRAKIAQMKVDRSKTNDEKGKGRNAADHSGADSRRDGAGGKGKRGKRSGGGRGPGRKGGLGNGGSKRAIGGKRAARAGGGKIRRRGARGPARA